jgi:hypothetical protein
MIQNPFSVGDEVLASRAQDGENHEPAKVVDAYSLIMGGDETPMVVVQFPEGDRAYLRADGPDVRPADPEPEAGEGEGEAGG